MDCVFCKIASGEIDSPKIYDDGELFCVRDINPAAKTHLLIIPHKHIPTLLEVKPDDEALLSRAMLVARQVARDAGIAEDGFRLVFNVNEGGGQQIFHIHFHLLAGGKLPGFGR
ncbi:histidine triad nucleotide-binding protein [bacterium]|nr:histidine triad nucleotide-binding protein [bacterium]